MRLLVVQAHPAPGSFGAALARAVIAGAGAAGHEVRALDLCAEGFDPVMGEAEWRAYDAPTEDPVLSDHAGHLLWAEGLVFVHPTWWMGPPAILKGWLDRVWRPGFAFHIEGGRMRPGLTGIRLIGVVTTTGSPWWVWALLMGAPGRKMLLRAPLACTGLRTRTLWLALHGMDRTTPARRERFLARVRARMARL